MSDKVKYVGSGLSFPAILTIIFVFLRAFDVITWSWWWVLAPFWAPIAFVIILLLAVIICYIIYGGR